MKSQEEIERKIEELEDQIVYWNTAETWNRNKAVENNKHIITVLNWVLNKEAKK